MAYRWRSLPRVRGLGASEPQGSSKRVLLPCLAGHRGPIINMCVLLLSFHLFRMSDYLWAHQLESHRTSPPSSYGVCLNLSHQKDSAVPFPSSTVKSNFVYPRNNRSPCIFYYYYFFFVKKNPSSCDCAEIRTHHVPTSEDFRGYQLKNHRGDRLFAAPLTKWVCMLNVPADYPPHKHFFDNFPT